MLMVNSHYLFFSYITVRDVSLNIIGPNIDYLSYGFFKLTFEHGDEKNVCCYYFQKNKIIIAFLKRYFSNISS